MQKRFIALFQDNLLSNGTKTLQELLAEAGYSSASVQQFSNVMAGLRPHTDPLIARLDKLRDAAMERMEATVGRADYADVSRAVHTLTHNIRLLTGKTTSNLGVIVRERRRELDDLIEG